MNLSRGSALTLLRWTLGLVVLWQSVQFVFFAASVHAFEKSGFPHWLRPVLGGTEIAAALLFLLPFSRRFGGYVLIMIFLLATFIHILHGQFDGGTLLVYASAAAATIATAPDPPRVQ